jgi:hypothetical protein
MPDGDPRRLSSTRRLSSLLEKVKAAQKEALSKEPPLVDKTQQVEFIQGRTAIHALTVTDALLENFIEQNLTTKATKKHGDGDKSHPTLWDLEETLIVAHPDGPVVKSLGKFSLSDGHRLTEQKKANIAAAVHAKKIWDWQWSHIEPLLVANPKWLFEDAYNDLASRGLPSPPDFDE